MRNSRWELIKRYSVKNKRSFVHSQIRAVYSVNRLLNMYLDKYFNTIQNIYNTNIFLRYIFLCVWYVFCWSGCVSSSTWTYMYDAVSVWVQDLVQGPIFEILKWWQTDRQTDFQLVDSIPIVERVQVKMCTEWVIDLHWQVGILQVIVTKTKIGQKSFHRRWVQWSKPSEPPKS